jgi:ribonuclease BN (tRNA processing enzyme)
VFRYVVREHDRRGNIDRAKVTAMGLKPGPLYRELAEGRDLTLPNGTVIRASEVRSFLWMEGSTGVWEATCEGLCACAAMG